jgi:hypothetical protein
MYPLCMPGIKFMHGEIISIISQHISLQHLYDYKMTEGLNEKYTSLFYRRSRRHLLHRNVDWGHVNLELQVFKVFMIRLQLLTI